MASSAPKNERKRGPMGRWWKSPGVRAFRRRISDQQVYLYPIAGLFMRAWAACVQRTVRYDRRGPAFDFIREGKPCVFVFWHQDVFPLMFEMFRYTPRHPTLFMVSPGRAGTIGSYLLKIWKIDVVEGSDSKGGIDAIEELSRIAKETGRCIFIAADGSRGPSRQARWGAVHLAKNTGLPIVALRAWGSRLRILDKTWMKLALPKLWGRAVVLSAEPLYVPGDADKKELDSRRLELERRLNEMCEAGERYFAEDPSAADPWGPPIDRPVEPCSAT